LLSYWPATSRAGPFGPALTWDYLVGLAGLEPVIDLGPDWTAP
jgi:hypothetical protein